MYGMKKAVVKDQINILLVESIKEELKFRYDAFLSNDTIQYLSKEEVSIDTTSVKGELNPDELVLPLVVPMN
jgi:hypothetical protein